MNEPHTVNEGRVPRMGSRFPRMVTRRAAQARNGAGRQVANPTPGDAGEEA